MTGADMVHVQLMSVDPQNVANTRLLWEATGDPIECHYVGARWVENAAADPARADIYQRFLARISGLADQPPPASGISIIIINNPLRRLWSGTWPWAPTPPPI